jgi:hypothetical protein
MKRLFEVRDTLLFVFAAGVDRIAAPKCTALRILGARASLGTGVAVSGVAVSGVDR